jgi:hypothetical protein
MLETVSRPPLFMKSALKRGVLFLLVLALALATASCSFVNTFIVVNASRARLEIRYHVKVPTHPGAPARLYENAPVTKPRSQLDDDREWKPLPSSRYQIDADNRIVVLTLEPDEALFLTKCRPANRSTTGDCESEDFEIDEIRLRGANGEADLTGEQAHKIFVRDKNNYTLTYY